MRTILIAALAVVLGGFTSSVRAEEKKADPKAAVTLKGTILCTKCALGEGTKCATAIQVKKDGKSETFRFEDKGANEEYHETVCGGDKVEGIVIGSITEKDGKKFIKPTKVTYAKK